MMKLTQTVMPVSSRLEALVCTEICLWVCRHRRIAKERTIGLSTSLVGVKFRTMYWAATPQQRRRIRAIAHEMLRNESRPPQTLTRKKPRSGWTTALFSPAGVNRKLRFLHGGRLFSGVVFVNLQVLKSQNYEDFTESAAKDVVSLGMTRGGAGFASLMSFVPHTDLSAVGTDIADVYTLTAADLTLRASQDGVDGMP